MKKKLIFKLLLCMLPLTASAREVPEFFSDAPATLMGRFTCDADSRPKSFLVQARDVVLGEDRPVTVVVADDGSFCATVPVAYPQIVYADLKPNGHDQPFYFYLTRGDSLEVVFSAQSSKNQKQEGQLLNVTFKGRQARTNECLQLGKRAANVSIPGTKGVKDAAAFVRNNYMALDETQRKVDSLATAANFTPQERKLVMLEQTAAIYRNFLDYYFEVETVERGQSYQYTLSEVEGFFPKGFFNFLTQMPLDDLQLLCVSKAGQLFNRLRFSIYGFGWTKDLDAATGAETGRYGSPAAAHLLQCRQMQAQWQRLTGHGGPLPIVMQAVVAQETCEKINDDIDTRLLAAARDTLLTLLDDARLRSAVNRLFDETYADAHAAKSHPIDTSTLGGRILSRLAEPYRGKYLLIDFWGTTCGPCRAEIEGFKTMRDSLRNDSRIAFLFVSSPESSPNKSEYDHYVNKHLKDDHSLFLTTTEFYQLREYLHFLAVPFYATITPNGQLLYQSLNYRQIGYYGVDRLLEYVEQEPK